MKTKHTEGEWKYELDDDKFIISSPGKLNNIAWCPFHPVTKERQDANAKLISQSPKMYKLCMERLNKMQRGLDEGYPMDSKVIPEYKELLAIKKATN